ncbi:HK97 family phage prohead protease [Bosea sp. NPDC055353]
MIVKGWASTSDKDDKGNVMLPGAFDLSLSRRLPSEIALLVEHDESRPAGRILKLESRNGGLWIEAELDPALPDMAARIEFIERTRKHGFSVGGFASGYVRNETKFIEAFDLREISIGLRPANDRCVMIFPQSIRPSGWGTEMDDIWAEMAAWPKPRPLNLPPIRYPEQEPAL